MDSAVENPCEEAATPHRSGHTAAVEGNTLFVWGGYMSTADNEVFLPNDEIWLYDLKSAEWEMYRMSGEVPPPMSGVCGSALGGCLYIFGGCDDNGQTNELYCVNLLDGNYSWRKVRAETGTPPSPRDKLCCWVFNNWVTYFGGYGHKKLDDVWDDNSFNMDTASLELDVGWGWNNEVHVFDTVLSSWTEPNTCGRAPSPRAAHAGATLGHKGYVHGGRGMYTTTCDIHCLDLKSWTWSEVVPVSTVPAGRSWHSLTTVSESTLFLFGGINVDCKPMSDGWIFDVEMKKWSKFKHRNKNQPRLWHTASQTMYSDVLVFGGCCDYIHLVGTFENLTGHSNHALVIQTQPYPLFWICEDYIAKNVKNLGKQGCMGRGL
ncbi:kelch domain-containing protein 1-like isoform X2 [Esox lucius]|uniref:kelch domain-containing protein 1-like isoform X2 n=1 Tax=Esox lucius TaxID=8010 RepID=UPI001476F946|nr:kelch domain-containing protein 1-like isoform X2 [Esox lucius]